MAAEETGADYQLTWPRRLFQEETADLLNSRDKVERWDDRCELLLEDAFWGDAPRDDFLALPAARGGSVAESRKAFLVNLLRRAPTLREGSNDRAPYWSERQRGRKSNTLSFAGAVREFVTAVGDLEIRGYFEKVFDKDCVDSPAELIALRFLSARSAWPTCGRCRLSSWSMIETYSTT